MQTENSFSHFEGPCPYLPGRSFLSANAWANDLPAQVYIQLLGRFWRRSGCLIYRPRCTTCSECLPLRVLVQDFAPSKSQRRTFRKNQDLTVRIGPPVVDELRLKLYEQYQENRHQTQTPEAERLAQYKSFLVESPVKTLEFSYWLGPQLIAVGIVDDLEKAASSVYFYYDLQQKDRRLGVFSMLIELEWARKQGYAHHYLGYWIQECSAMAYKSDYRPAEVLRNEDCWEALPN